jgi:hypothetical protein
LLISANDIKQWALTNNREAQDTLPELIRRMILESDSKAQKVDIPSGDSVALSGLDGLVISESGFYPDQFLPAGESIWEFGCDKNVGTKINNDFEKRSKEKSIKNKKAKSYVAVSPQAWTKKGEWEKEKRKKKTWKTVRGLNAEDLAQWLDRCPQTRDWFASTVLGQPLADLAAEALPVLLLTGGWDTLYQADKDVVSTITGRPHEAVEASLQKLSKSKTMLGASLFHKENSRWKLLAPELAWEIAESCITEDTFNRLFTEVQAIFSEVPQDYVPPGEMTTYPVHQIGQGYSSLLKEGLAEALARIATTTNREAPGYSGYSPQGKVDLCLREVFNNERRYNPAFWMSISPHLSTLAEAWDGELLDCLEDVLHHHPEALRDLFQSPKYSFWSSTQSNLLFALQELAWNPIHLSRVADILLVLRTFVEPKSNNWGPVSAFQELFVGFTANTTATLEEQRKILARLLNTSVEEVWPLLLASIPTQNTIVVCRSEPQFRKLDSTIERSPNTKEYYEYVEALWELAIQYAGNSARRWINLLEDLSEIRDHKLFEKFISTLEERIGQLESDTESLWEKLLLTLAHHMQFPDSGWSFSANELKMLEKVAEKLKPSDVRKHFRPLFVHNAMDLHDTPLDDDNDRFDEMDQTNLERRKDALQRLLADLDEKAFATYALELINDESFAIYTISNALANIFDTDEAKYTSLIKYLVNQPDQMLQRLAAATLSGVVRGKDNKYDITWAETLAKGLTETGIATIWSVFPPVEAVWGKVQESGTEVERLYWEMLNPTPSDCESGGELLASKLLENKQTLQAIECIGWILYNKQEPSPELVLDALSLFATSPPERDLKGTQIRAYTVEKLVHYLETKAELSKPQIEKLAQIEWVIFPILKRPSKKFKLSLFKSLANDPGFFVEMLSMIYAPDDGKEKETREKPTEQQKNLAERAFDVLRAWNILPGEKNSDIDSAAVSSWYDRGIELARISQREVIFNINFGQKLGACPLKGKDGHWPHDAIRVLLERPGADDLKSSFKTGKRNAIWNRAREVHQARQDDNLLAVQLKDSARKIASDYPKTAYLLLSLATEIEEHWIRRAF